MTKSRHGSPAPSGATTGGAAPDRCLLHRRNPSVKLILVCVLATAVIAITDPVTPAVLYALALLGVLGARTMRPGELVIAQWPFALFALSLFVVNIATRHGGQPVDLGPVTVSSHGLSIGASMAARTLFVGVLSLAFVRSTQATSLMTSLYQHVRVPAAFTYAVLAAFRLLEQMPHQWQAIRQAQAVRDPARKLAVRGRAKTGAAHRHAGGAPLPQLRVSTSPRMLLRAAFTLLVVNLRRSERLAISMQTRALGLGPRTIYRPVDLTRADFAFAACVLVAAAAVVVATAWAGYLRGPANLLG